MTETTIPTNMSIEDVISSVVNATLDPNITLDPNVNLDQNEELARFEEILGVIGDLNKEYEQTIKFYDNVLNKDGIYYTLIICPIVLSIVINGLGLYETKQLTKFKVWIHVLSLVLGLIYLSLMTVVLVFRKNILDLFDKMNEALKQHSNNGIRKDKIDEILQRFNIVSIVCGITGFWSFSQGSYKLYCCLGKGKK